MRTTGKLAIVAAVVAGAAVPMTAPASAQASAAGGWEAYHGLTTKQSVERATRLMKQGYRPITVNVSDGERYAAVWEKGGSPDQYGIWQGMSASGYQKRFDAAMKQGGQPVSVSATGPAGSAVFAAVFEKKRGAFLAKSNLKGSVFAAYNKHAEANGLALTSVDAYGTPGDVRYAAVWSANTGGASGTTPTARTSSSTRPSSRPGRPRGSGRSGSRWRLTGRTRRCGARTASSPGPITWT
ncbi:hypothetical protein GCM10020001_060700 [Nonomuraea salmonea]